MAGVRGDALVEIIMTQTLTQTPNPSLLITTASPRASRAGDASSNVRSIQMAIIDSPVGKLRLLASGGELVGLDLPNHQAGAVEGAETDSADPLLTRARLELEEYFAGARQTFDLPLGLQGTPFQQAVWTALYQIPFAETISYRELARRVERPSAVRAVGAANGRNPIAIIIPCHRVIGANGELVGYGGGLPLKRWLIDHEAKTVRGQFWIG